MADSDRDKWNARYRERGENASTPSPAIVELAEFLPPVTPARCDHRALDVAGGSGRHAIWLAERGFRVTVVDVAKEGLALAARAATARGIELETVIRDLDTEPLPDGPFDVILCHHFLYPSLFDESASRLAPNGVVVAVHPTQRNLERHPRPSARFLFEEGALRRAADGWEILHADEGWQSTGRHEARVVARPRSE